MARDRLAVEFERGADGHVMLRVNGRLERGTAALLEGILQALRDEPAPVVLDLSCVDHIDAKGLDVLLNAEAEARRRRAHVEVVGVRESLHGHRAPFE
jgi:anti-anti-sigma factor